MPDGPTAPSPILTLAAILKDKARISEIGSQIVIRQIKQLVDARLGGVASPDWDDVWKDSGTWGKDTWNNHWTGDTWGGDSVARTPRPGPGRGPGTPSRQGPGVSDLLPETVFSREEISILRDLKLLP